MQEQSYRINVLGSINETWSAYLSGMAVTEEPDGVGKIQGPIADQSALHGVLNKIRDLNLKIISVQLLDSNGVTPVECRYCWRISQESKEDNK